MATIRAFKAIRPDASYAQKVAALPYDVMSSEEAREMVKDNPYSFLHIDKAEIDLDENIDIYDERVYEKAKDNLNKMIEDKIFIEESKPVMYIYMLTMNGRSQTGLVVCTAIDEYIEGIIKKHELTREDKEKDRIRHVEMCNANTGPIFLTYRSQNEINEKIESCKNNKPIYDFSSEDGIEHKVWIIEDENTIDFLTQKFESVKNLYIADGHHRNASAVKVGLNKRLEKGRYFGNEEFNYYLSVIFPDEQLYIMDYNRLVKDLNGLTEDEFINKVKEKFVIENSSDGKPDRLHSFGMYLSGKWYKLTAKDEIIKDDSVEALDVSILQNELLNPILNIDDPRTNKRIDFVGGMRGLKELEKRVNSGEMQVAFAMYPTSMSELLKVADEDRIMPPKSTWFEPKLRSGLFIHKLD